MFRRLLISTALLCLLAAPAAAQGLTGALIGTVKDEQGLPIQAATVRVSSPARDVLNALNNTAEVASPTTCSSRPPRSPRTSACRPPSSIPVA